MLKCIYSCYKLVVAFDIRPSPCAGAPLSVSNQEEFDRKNIGQCGNSLLYFLSQNDVILILAVINVIQRFIPILFFFRFSTFWDLESADFLVF